MDEWLELGFIGTKFGETVEIEETIVGEDEALVGSWL